MNQFHDSQFSLGENGTIPQKMKKETTLFLANIKCALRSNASCRESLSTLSSRRNYLQFIDFVEYHKNTGCSTLEENSTRP
jgi:hypothetical protein